MNRIVDLKFVSIYHTHLSDNEVESRGPERLSSCIRTSVGQNFGVAHVLQAFAICGEGSEPEARSVFLFE